MIDIKRKLDHNHHSVFLLQYHLMLVVKYRHQIFDEQTSARAQEIFSYISPKYHISLEEWNADRDHIHILFRAHPKSELSKFINAYKSASSRLLKQEFPCVQENIHRQRVLPHLDRVFLRSIGVKYRPLILPREST